jgi:hypothetical protein
MWGIRTVMPSPRRLVPLSVAVASWLVSSSVEAIEGQWHTGGGLGTATFARTETGWAPLIGAHVAYEISDMFDARLELTASRHSIVEGVSTDFYGAAAGLSYKVDVIEWVPYFGLLVGYYAFSGRARPEPLQQRELGIMVPLGLEYVPSRTLAFGLQVAYHGFMSDPMDSVGDAPYISVLLRAEYRWGW